MTFRLACVAALLSTLTACGSGESDGVGGVSASEAHALNEAAAKLDARTGAAVSNDMPMNPAAAAAIAADRGRIAAPPTPPPSTAQ